MTTYFVTGTDTDAGKTLATSALLCAARQRQLTTLGLKPIASGSEATPSGLRNHDALALQVQSFPPVEYPTVNPWAFAPAIAPHLAALEAGAMLNVARVTQALRATLSHTPRDLTLIEGAGGWRVPLNDSETLADFARELRLPVILVVGLRLGCINHACLTAEAIEADGLQVAGWVANGIDPHMDVQQDNLNYLLQWFERRGIPHLGTVPHLSGIDPFDAEQLTAVANCLRWPAA